MHSIWSLQFLSNLYIYIYIIFIYGWQMVTVHLSIKLHIYWHGKSLTIFCGYGCRYSLVSKTASLKAFLKRAFLWIMVNNTFKMWPEKSLASDGLYQGTSITPSILERTKYCVYLTIALVCGILLYYSCVVRYVITSSTPIWQQWDSWFCCLAIAIKIVDKYFLL